MINGDLRGSRGWLLRLILFTAVRFELFVAVVCERWNRTGWKIPGRPSVAILYVYYFSKSILPSHSSISVIRTQGSNWKKIEVNCSDNKNSGTDGLYIISYLVLVKKSLIHSVLILDVDRSCKCLTSASSIVSLESSVQRFFLKSLNFILFIHMLCQCQ